MTFEELTIQLQKLKCREKRVSEKDYCEVVVAREDLAAAAAVLESFFGPALKPAGKDASAEARRHAEPHGGIYGNQTLYYHASEKTSELALLWPWGSGDLITLKIIRQPLS